MQPPRPDAWLGIFAGHMPLCTLYVLSDEEEPYPIRKALLTDTGKTLYVLYPSVGEKSGTLVPFANSSDEYDKAMSELRAVIENRGSKNLFEPLVEILRDN